MQPKKHRNTQRLPAATVQSSSKAKSTQALKGDDQQSRKRQYQSDIRGKMYDFTVTFLNELKVHCSIFERIDCLQMPNLAKYHHLEWGL